MNWKKIIGATLAGAALGTVIAGLGIASGILPLKPRRPADADAKTYSRPDKKPCREMLQ